MKSNSWYLNVVVTYFQVKYIMKLSENFVCQNFFRNIMSIRTKQNITSKYGFEKKKPFHAFHLINFFDLSYDLIFLK